MGFGVLFLSCQSYFLQTFSREVLEFQVYLIQFSQCRKKLGHKLCSSFTPVLSEELTKMSFFLSLTRVSSFSSVFFQCLLENAPDKGRTILPLNS